MTTINVLYTTTALTYVKLSRLYLIFDKPFEEITEKDIKAKFDEQNIQYATIDSWVEE